MRKVPDAEVRAAERVLDRVRSQWLRRPGVTAVDVGFRFRGGVMTDELAIRVHVRRKLPAEALPAHELLPESIEGIPVDVIEAEYGPQAGAS